MGVQQLISGRSVARHSLLNAVTKVVLIALGLVFVPLMIRSFGMELYGVLTVTWMVLGQLGWLNAGLGKASTKYVADDLASGNADQAGLWTWTAVVTQVALGLIGTLLLWIFAPELADLLRVQPRNRDLVIFALRVFGIALPIDLALSSVIGVLQATHQFVAINALSVAGAVWMYSVYALAIWNDGSMHTVVYGLVAFKVVNIIAAYWIAARRLPSLRRVGTFMALARTYRSRVASLVSFGGWMTVSSAVGPFLLYFDRWVVSSVLGAVALPFYTVPFGVLSRLSVFPASLTTTLFPTFSTLQARNEWERLDEFFVRSHRYLLLVLIPVLFVLFTWANEILRLWIDPQFAATATLPFRILIVGFAVALLAPVTGTLFASGGRPDRLTGVYLVELPVNVALVLYLTREYGLVGAALSFTIRAVVETITLWIVLYRTFPISGRKLLREGFRPIAGFAVGMACIAYVWRGADLRDLAAILVTALSLVAYAWLSYTVALDGRDKLLIKGFLTRG